MPKKAILTKQDKKFVKEVVTTGNLTQSVKKAYKIKDDKYASVKGQRMIAKDRIQKAIMSIADALPDKDLIRVHKEGLEAGKTIYKNNNTSGEIEEVGYEPDYATRHKYLDSAYKLKGSYAAEKSINLNINARSIDPTDPKVIEALRILNKQRANEQ